MLGMGDGHQLAGCLHRRIEQFVLDAHVDIQFDEKLIETVLALVGRRRHRGDLLAQPAQRVVVVEQHLKAVHRAPRLPTSHLDHSVANSGRITRQRRGGRPLQYLTRLTLES